MHARPARVATRYAIRRVIDPLSGVSIDTRFWGVYQRAPDGSGGGRGDDLCTRVRAFVFRPVLLLQPKSYRAS